MRQLIRHHYAPGITTKAPDDVQTSFETTDIRCRQLHVRSETGGDS